MGRIPNTVHPEPGILPQTQPIGGFPALATYLGLIHDPVARLTKIHQQHGRLSLWGGITPFRQSTPSLVLAFGPEYNREILSNPNVFRARGMVLQGPKGSAHNRIRFGLVSMNGEQHDQQRHALNPLLQKKKLEEHHQAIVHRTNLMLNTWEFGETRDIWRDMQSLLICLSGGILLGIYEEAPLLRLGRRIDTWLTRCFDLKVMLFQIPFPGTPYSSLLRLAEQIEDDIRLIINLQRQHPNQGNGVLSDLILAQGTTAQALTEEEVIGQVNILFLAAYETCVNGLAWTLFLLSQHPEILADLREELSGELRGDAPRVDQFDRLPLLSNVIHESLRLFPPVVWATRVVDQPVELGPYHLAKGTRVVYSPYVTHRLPDLFEEPTRFLPRRWTILNSDPYGYLPFGAGPRRCIGFGLGMTMLQLILPMVIQRYNLALAPGARINRQYNLTLAPQHGLPMTVLPLHRSLPANPPLGNINEMVALNGWPTTTPV